MKIGSRLILGFLVVIALLIGMAGTGIFEMRLINQGIENMMENTISVERRAREWARAAASQGATVCALSYATEPEMLQQFVTTYLDYRKVIDDEMKYIYESSLTKEEEDMLKDIEGKRTAFRDVAMTLFKLKNVSPTGELLGEHPPFSEVKEHLLTKVIPARDAYVKAVDNFRDFGIKKSYEQETSMYAGYRRALIIMIVISIAAVLVALIMAWRLTVGITRPLDNALKVAETVASGDLTSHIEVSSTDETGRLMQALKNMNECLFEAIVQVRQSAETIATASSEIASGNQDLSARTEEQASSLEQTASSMEEITTTVRQNGDNAKQANQLASQAAEVATRGGEAARHVAHTMNDISESSSKIVDIISVIDGIAFQTNILALNAAVEAARAGEQGRGFAVVATEVRSLAQRSATAAREIKNLIDDSVHKVSTGTELVNNAVDTMLEIGESITRVNDIMNEITIATQEQVQGIEQINLAVSEMDTTAQQNAALVEEAAAAAESLQDQAKTLVGVVNLFNIGGKRMHIDTHSSHAKKKAAAPARQLSSPPKKTPSGTHSDIPASENSEDWDEF
ncbi:MAG: HAMP domain-containing protein [Oxalobacter sp.]|nr:HAMP domain-containing protein [Oxalobacter sp.]